MSIISKKKGIYELFKKKKKTIHPSIEIALVGQRG